MATSLGWPVSNAEWQEAVNLATLLLLVDSGRQYGLITCSLDIDAERCRQILETGAARGFRPDEIEVDTLMRAIARGG